VRDTVEQEISLRYWRNAFFSFLRRVRVSDQTFIIVLAAIIGIVVGAGALLFGWLLETGSWFFREVLPGWILSPEHAHWLMAVIPALGGLLLAPFILFFPKEATLDGVPSTMESVALKNGFMRWQSAFLRMVMSALTLGSGGSAGSEGPIIQIGSALASGVGQLFRVSGERLRVIVACGAAAGLASIFNAPIAGVLFALEVILGEFNVFSFSPIVISSVVAVAFSRAALPRGMLLRVPSYNLYSPWEIVLYAAMGILAGFASIAFTRSLQTSERFFHEHVRLHKAFKPAIGGFMVGLIGLWLPHIYGYSYVPITQAIDGKFLPGLLFLLVAMKILATALTLGSGGSGGILCPALFLGAMLGSGCGALFHTWFPHVVPVAGGYGIVGMGAMLGAVVQAPMTAIIMVFEMTNAYTVILPMMVACILSSLVQKSFLKGSVYTLNLSKKGIDIHAGREMGILSNLRVKEIMEASFLTIPASTPYEEVVQTCLKNVGNYLYVVDDKEELVGVVTFSDLKEFIFEDWLRGLVLAKDLANTDVVYVTPDESLASSLNKFSFIDMEQLPVVDKLNGSGKLQGILTRSGLFKAYRQEMLKRVLIRS
jgi:CIC family chloride channel protein